jgi:precorrin-8X/cobalt-precorrin-8 methylmutase
MSAEPTNPDIGRRILQESFAIIERELGPHSLPPWAFAVVRRMIHASADFDFARTLCYSADFSTAIQQAFHERFPLITDTEMVLLGIRAAVRRLSGVTAVCHLNDPETRPLAQAEQLTRCAAGMRRGGSLYATPIVVVGNAPTALDETLRLVGEGWRPAAIIGLPVGFVGVEEAKRRLREQTCVPYLSCSGRKGGSGVAAAAVNALIEMSERT